MINFTSKHQLNTDFCCGDKSVSHRALILAALATTPGTIRNVSLCDDVFCTVQCLRALGAQISVCGTTATVQPIVHAADGATLCCGNSGTTARLLAGVVAGLGVSATFTGDKSLSKRPMQRVLQPLEKMGARVETGSGFLFKILPSQLQGTHVDAAVTSAQVKSAVLLAGLFARGKTSYAEQVPTRDHTENLLKHFGADVQVDGCKVTVGTHAFCGAEIDVPNDLSSVAFCLALALLDGQRATFCNVGVNPRRTGFVRVLQKAGANIVFTNQKVVCGEPVADICVEPSRLGALFADKTDVCDGIDELPMLIALALSVAGKHRFCGVSELRFKESDRIAALQKTAETLGQKVLFDGENLTVESNGILPRKPHFCDFSDHRIAMCQAVLALSVCGGGSVDCGNFDVSFPQFLQAVGVRPLRFALVGSGIADSLSPALVRHLANRAEVCCSYTLVDLPADVSDEKLARIVAAFDGVNVTMPFKTRVAQIVGSSQSSVNTVWGNNACSTDRYGIVQSLLAHNVNFANSQLWIVGAGGAAEACIAELAQHGCKMQVFNRTESKVERLAAKYPLASCPQPVGVLSFVPACEFERDIQLPQTVQFVLVADYKTPSGIAKQAQKRGIEVIGGLEMLYHQGAQSFALWTGTKVQNDFESFKKEVQK